MESIEPITHSHTVQLAALLCTLYILYRFAKIFILAFDSNLRQIPGPWLSSFTNIPLKIAVLSGKRTVYIHALHEKYGPLVRIAPDEIAVTEINAWRQIHRVGSPFKKHPGWYQSQSPFQYDDETCGVFGICDPKKASTRRRLFLLAGTKKIVAEWESRIVQLTQLVVNKIKQDLEKGQCDVMKWWTLLASDVSGELAFGEPLGGVENGVKNQMIQDIEALLPLAGLRQELPWAYHIFIFSPFSRNVKRIWERFFTYNKLAVSNTRQAWAKGVTKTLFSKMLPDGEPQDLPSSLIEQEAQNVLIAGTDTTAMTLTYLTFAVLKDETVKRRLIEELQAGPEHPTGEQLESLTYLNNVIKESMRLNPAIPGTLPRAVPEAGATFGKYFLPRGTVVSTQAWTFHRDRNVFEHPEKFDPDRWLSPTPEMNEHWMPFGGPARFCIGRNIAQLEILHAVSALFRESERIQLASSTTDESMEMVDYFAIKPKAAVCMIVRE